MSVARGGEGAAMRANLNNQTDTYRKLPDDTACIAEGHNSAQYLDVVWLENIAHWSDVYQIYVRRRGRRTTQPGGLAAGWYVVRICPAHRGSIISRRYD